MPVSPSTAPPPSAAAATAAAAAPGRSWPRRLGRLLAIVVLAEVALQVLAIVAWLGEADVQARAAAGGDTRAVLCLGDSLTFGTGATRTERSYPHQLEQHLNTATDGWSVVNAGRPGRNSREALEALDNQLGTFEPEVVCLMVGANDFWSRPDELRLPAVEDVSSGSTAAGAGGGGSSFPLRFRLGRLANIAVSIVRGDAGPAAALAAAGSRPFLGSWRGEHADLEFRRNGSLVFGRLDGNWFVQDERVHLRFASREIAAAWELDPDGNLLLCASDWAAPLRFEPCRSTERDAGRRGWAAARRGDLDTAHEAFRKAAADPRTAVAAEARIGLVHVAHARGDEDALRTELAWFEERAREASGDDPTALGRLVDARVEAGRTNEAVADGCRLLELAPTHPSAWAVLAMYGATDEHGATIRTALDAALERAGDDRDLQLWLLRAKAPMLRAAGDPEAALRCFLAAAARDGRDDHLVLEVRRHSERYDTAMLTRCLAALAPDADVAERLRVSFAKATRSSTDEVERARVLESHLRQMVTRCRAHGARVILLCYPYFAPHVEKVIDSVVTSGDDVEAVHLRPHFDELLRSTPHEELFVLDGHCSDRGYAEIARLLAARILG